MQNKNSKSESYIVKEAESIIEKYIESRKFRDIGTYCKLEEKYRRLKILTIASLITFFIGMFLSIVFK